ncbi:MAG TPA: hypothetical protein DCM07_00470, partial [Planctomycetaceae bacterium]|nr:hypothetical protein [Planctomycetaceae bacterium]
TSKTQPFCRIFNQAVEYLSVLTLQVIFSSNLEFQQLEQSSEAGNPGGHSGRCSNCLNAIVHRSESCGAVLHHW